MATTYKSTIEVNVWKEHACIGCGSRFRYLFKRKKTGQGGSPEAAKMALDVTYPELHGNQWQPVKGHYEHTQDIRLSDAGAGGRYQIWWWGGYLGGVLLLVVSSLLLIRLSSGLRQLAQPTSIFTPGEGEQEEDVPEVLPADLPRRDEDEGIVRGKG